MKPDVNDRPAALLVHNELPGHMEASTKNRARPLSWHVISAEYPPQPGGVSDYTGLVAAGLANRGDEVNVWCPAFAGVQPKTPGVNVHRQLGRISPADLRRIGRELDHFPGSRRILVQWVPHGYGYRSMNLGFCWWLRNRARRHGDKVEIMLHEPYLPFGMRSWRQNAAAVVHRLMTMILLRAADRVWVSIPEWERKWRPYALGRPIPFQWLPIPSSIPVVDNREAVETIRRRYAANGELLIGHFGTYGWPVTDLLEPILAELNDRPGSRTVLLMGINSKEFRERLLKKHPRLEPLVQAIGALSPEDISHHLSACDILIQPFPDGVSSRRTSVMAALSHGRPVVTTIGALSEDFWKNTDALAQAPAGDTIAFVSRFAHLEQDAGERARLASAARKVYAERFDIQHTVTALRKTASTLENPACES